MTARFVVADVFDGLDGLDPASVDLILSSPPFLAVRSYLPPDHPDKAKEIGSEATPADYLDTLLDVVEACARVLAPHGSLVFELGDTYSGSGGAGGDYAGWSDCGHGPDNFRPGRVLDPFAGSGTTLAVATGHGYDAIGLDIDERNADLARERCGLFLTVEEAPA
jgi:DNA modification methylase